RLPNEGDEAAVWRNRRRLDVTGEGERLELQGGERRAASLGCHRLAPPRDNHGGPDNHGGTDGDRRQHTPVPTKPSRRCTRRRRPCVGEGRRTARAGG